MTSTGKSKDLPARSEVPQGRTGTELGSDVTVVICCYDECRWDLLLKAIDSVRSQESPPVQIVLAVDHNRALSDRLARSVADISVVDNEGLRGASETRNVGARLATTTLVAFLDDDVHADARWLGRLVEPFRDSTVVGTGGWIVPIWPSSRPRWWPSEFNWAVGGTYTGHSTELSEVRNVWTGNMAVRRIAFQAVGGFRPEFAKVGNVSRPEDTDLCVRMARAATTATDRGRWIFVPDASVDHHIEIERTRFRYFLWRCCLEGRGKVELARFNDGRRDLRREQTYLYRTVTRGLWTYLREGLRNRDIDHFRRAGAVIAGVTAAGAGAAFGLARAR